MEYSRIVAIFVTFLCVALAVWQERAEGVCVLTRSFVVTRSGALFTESSLLFLIWHSQWLQAKEPMGPMTVSVARGIWWDLWLSVWPMAVGGTTCGFWHGPWSSVWPEAVSGTCGVWHGPWLSVAPVVVSGA